ncbi:MAG: sigma factor [Mycobacteriales bacterium]
MNGVVDLAAADFELYDRLLARDPSAVLECLDRFGAAVYCIALAESGDVARAEDLTERAFVELWRHAEEFDPGRAPIVLQVVRRLLAYAPGTSAP